MARPAAAYESAVPPRPACVYSSCYCEENVWKLCEYIRRRDQYPLEEFFAVFISNERRMIPLWKQKSGRGDEAVVWDSRVVLLHVSSGEQNYLENGNDLGNLRTFASDRSDMKDANGKWQKPPASYPCVETAAIKMDLAPLLPLQLKLLFLWDSHLLKGNCEPVSLKKKEKNSEEL
ncbi:protein N-terminal glutamine amidohydrolase-like [Eudromia elegans]